MFQRFPSMATSWSPLKLSAASFQQNLAHKSSDLFLKDKNWRQHNSSENRRENGLLKTYSRGIPIYSDAVYSGRLHFKKLKKVFNFVAHLQRRRFLM